MFIDRVRIHARAGNGGHGCASFRREKFIPKGGPDGGDGGEGGDVILQASTHLNQLAPLFYEPILRAKNGAPGSSRQKHGKSAPNLVIPVPIGTMVYRLPAPDLTPKDEDLEFIEEQDVADEQSTAPTPKKKGLPAPDPEDLVGDLVEHGQEFILCHGGHGGRGNIHFKSSRNRAPRRFTEGTEGEESWFLLEMRTIAFAGLVGYPNAGKSTLLGALSSAHPKIGAYPFTTRHPSVGVVELGDYLRTTVADIPGLIEGASENRGLGHEFLRHIMRCRFLLFVLDMGGSEGRDPYADFLALKKELELYSDQFKTLPWAVVANKMDLPEATVHLERFRKEEPQAVVIPLCAELGEGVEQLKDFLKEQERLLALQTSSKTEEEVGVLSHS